MSLISVILVIIVSVFVSEIRSKEMFCEKNRSLLLGGVFNYENLLFGYSWKVLKNERNPQLMLVWTFEIKKNSLAPIGRDMPVEKVFPGINLFKAGVGLTLKCVKTDTKCQSYRQLVFIFFQTKYKVFRFANNSFITETDKSKIPWGLKTIGENSDWYFGNPEVSGISAIMFLSGYQSQIFIVSENDLFVASVSIKDDSLKWKKLTEYETMGSVLGGFAVGSHLFINKNEEPDNYLLKFDRNGKHLETVSIKTLNKGNTYLTFNFQISVWDYFGCVDTENAENVVRSRDIGFGMAGAAQPEKDTIRETDDSLATILLICIVVAIVLVDIIVGAFWLSIYKKNKNPSEE